MNNKLLYGLIGVIVGAVGVWFLLTTSGVNNTYSHRMKPSANANTLDAHFIEQMIPHHEDAITMAKFTKTKAQRPEVKKLADDIISSQSKEIADMRTWYKNWFGRALPIGEDVMQHHGMMSTRSSMHMGMMGTDQDLEQLRSASDFDKEFVEEMIPHHQMAVMMASMLKDGTQRPEMKKLADDIITAQTKEIEQMRTWLEEWSK